MLKIGKRLVTKLFNAGKFVLANEADVGPVTEELDRAFLYKLSQLVEQATNALEEFDFANALTATEQFFWQNFTDNYLELAKNRAKGFGDVDEAERISAVAGLRSGLNILLRLFAPTLPYITEEIWSWAFAKEYGQDSIHTADWPNSSDFRDIEAPQYAESFDLAVASVGEIRKYKTEQGVSVAKEMDSLTLAGHPASLEKLNAVIRDVMAAVHVKSYTLQEDADMEQLIFTVLDGTFSE